MTKINYPETMKGADGRIYSLQLVTPDCIYYGNISESDENSSTLLFSRDMSVISDNYFAHAELMGEMDKPVNDPSFIFQSEEFKAAHVANRN